MEDWRPVPGFENRYAVSSTGSVRNTRTGRVLRPREDKDGYQLVNLFREGRPATRKIHHLVLEAFVGKRPPAFEADHKDRNRSNNSLLNLRWRSVSFNRRNRSGVKGVRQHRGGGWQAYARIDGVMRSLGSFAARDEAVGARKRFEDSLEIV